MYLLESVISLIILLSAFTLSMQVIDTFKCNNIKTKLTQDKLCEKITP